MAISRALANLCPHTVTIAPFSAYNAYSEPSFGTPVEYACLVEKKTRLVRTAENKEVVSSAAVYLASAPDINLKDQITLPDSTTPQILSFGTYPNQHGDYYTIIYL